MPITAIGKVFKPALRAIAIGRVMQERLAKAGIAPGVQVAVLEGPRGLRIEFRVDEAAVGNVAATDAAATRAKIEALMARVHVPFEIMPSRSAPRE